MHMGHWLSALHDFIPKPICGAVDAIYQNALSLLARYDGFFDLSASDILNSLNFQTILPPLISLLTIYFAVLSLYRTTSFFVRCTIFLVKWGAVVGTIAASLGYIANTFGLFNQNISSLQSRRNPLHAARPRPWNTFQQHQRWRAQEENQFVDAGRIAREAVERVIDTTQRVANQDGWWGALAGMVTKMVTREDTTTSGMREGRLKGGKGKGKIR